MLKNSELYLNVFGNLSKIQLFKIWQQDHRLYKYIKHVWDYDNKMKCFNIVYEEIPLVDQYL